MRSRSVVQLLALLSSIPILTGPAQAQSIPPFSQSVNYPTGHGSTASQGFNAATYDTAITFQPLAPPDNDWGIAPITTTYHFSGTTLHWKIELNLGNPLFRSHSYSPTLQCNALFRLYGLGPADTAKVNVRVLSVIAVVRDGNNGLTRGRVALTTNLGSAAHDWTHYMANTIATNTDTLVVPVRVLGSDQLVTFQLAMLDHVEMLDSYSPRVDVSADVSFQSVPPGMTVVNAYGYGSVVLDTPRDTSSPSTLRALARFDGREVTLWGVTPGAAGAEVTLFDVSGRRLASRRVDRSGSGEAVLGLSSPLTGGVYFVRCVDTSGNRSARFAFVR